MKIYRREQISIREGPYFEFKINGTCYLPDIVLKIGHSTLLSIVQLIHAAWALLKFLKGFY